MRYDPQQPRESYELVLRSGDKIVGRGALSAPISETLAAAGRLFGRHPAIDSIDLISDRGAIFLLHRGAGIGPTGESASVRIMAACGYGIPLVGAQSSNDNFVW